MRTAGTTLPGLATAVLVLVAACAPTASPSPQRTASPTTAPGPTITPTQAPTAAPTPVAVVPDGQILFKGKLVMCSDLPYPPMEYFDAQGNPVGVDIDLGREIARRLGLTLDVQNSVFDTIIAAVTGGKCDIIISSQNITADRQKQVDMIPYFSSGQAFMVAKGNPKGIRTLDDLCGKAIGAESGTTMAAYVKGADQYAGAGLTKACADKGRPAPTLKEYQKDNETVLALQAGQVDVYLGDVPVVANYATEKADLFEVAPVPALPGALFGISIPKDKTGLRDAVLKALVSMIDDGKYLEILRTHKVEGGAIKAADVKL